MSRLRLTLKAITFICNERDLDRKPDERELVVTSQVFDSAVALAESRKWRVPGRALRCRHLPRGAVADFVSHLRDALSEPAEQPGSRARNCTVSSPKSFFALPANRRELEKLTKFLATGGELTAEEELSHAAPVETHRGEQFGGRASRRSSL